MDTGTIKAIIVDDEKHASETLKWELNRSCPEIQIMAAYNNPEKAVSEIRKLDPDILFLDVEMPKMSGFDLLQQFDKPSFAVIFTTAYDQFALKAIKHSAIDYLLKPVEKEELKGAIDKYKQSKNKLLSGEQLDLLFSKVNAGDKLDRIALPTSDGLIFIKPEKIMRCESESNYTTVYFSDGKKHVISKTLKDIEELLNGHGFMRIHHSHLVNLSHITRYVKSDGGYVVLDDESHISVSRSRKVELLGLFS